LLGFPAPLPPVAAGAARPITAFRGARIRPVRTQRLRLFARPCTGDLLPLPVRDWIYGSPVVQSGMMQSSDPIFRLRDVDRGRGGDRMRPACALYWHSLRDDVREPVMSADDQLRPRVS